MGFVVRPRLQALDRADPVLQGLALVDLDSAFQPFDGTLYADDGAQLALDVGCRLVAHLPVHAMAWHGLARFLCIGDLHARCAS